MTEWYELFNVKSIEMLSLSPVAEALRGRIPLSSYFSLT